MPNKLSQDHFVLGIPPNHAKKARAICSKLEIDRGGRDEYQSQANPSRHVRKRRHSTESPNPINLSLTRKLTRNAFGSEKHDLDEQKLPKLGMSALGGIVVP
jgi:hypothetical protein